MAFRFGSQTPTSLRVGTAEIQRIYEGGQIVWNGINPIPVENALAGVADSTVGFNTIGSGTDGFYGYAKQFSRNVGESIGFAVDGVNATNIAIHRIGHYGGQRWRLIQTISNTPTNQPDTQVLPNSAGSRSAANWSTTATWNIPADAVSGLYVAVVRDAGNVARSWIPFIVREDGRTADIVLRVSDSTWGGAYNTFGTKANPLGGKSVYGEGKGGDLFSINLRGVQMSYDRPIVSRGTNAGDAVVNHWDILESALIDWVEKNGYNVKYISCYDLDQGLSSVGNAKILACAGHDEYWSEGMVNNTEAFIAGGGHHVSMSANSLFWRIRWADNGRTFWCYKDTMPGPTALRSGGAGTPLDPVSWTGTWRDTRWPQRRPENLLMGATFRMNGIRDETMVINGAANQAKPFWRNTTVAAGTNLTVPQVIGFEADSLDFPNSGGVDLGATTINIDGSYADDNGQTYGNNGTLNWGIACHYPRPQAASGLSIHFSTNQWMWGLSNYHRRGGAVINREMRQATYNMFTDLGAVAATKESDLTTVAPVALSTYGATRVDQVSVAVAPSTVLEDGTPNLVFTFTRAQTTGNLTVNYTIGGTATNGTDYATIGTSVVIPNGSTTATVTINPTTEATFEDDETVILTVASGTGYAIGSPATATGTITNDDAAIVGYLNTSNVTLAQGTTSKSAALGFTPTSGSLLVAIATSAAQFNSLSAGWTKLQENSPSNGAWLSMVATKTSDGTETAFAWTQNGARACKVTFFEFPAGYSLIAPNNWAQITIQDNANINVSGVAINQAAGTLIHARGYGHGGDDTSAEISLTYATSGSLIELNDGCTSGNPSDEAALYVGAHTFTDGPKTLSWTQTPSNGVEPGSGARTLAITMVAYNGPPTLTIAATNASRPEGNSGNTAFTFTVTRSGNLTGTSTVNWAVTGSGGNPANAADFGGTLPSGTLTFVPNDTSEVITVNVSGDATSEPNEGFTVTLSNPTNAVLGASTATGTITDDDTGPASYQLVSDATVGANSTASNNNDPDTYEMGTQFIVSQNCNCTAIKFLRPLTNNVSGGFNARTWTVRLWNENTATVIGTATVSTAANQTGWITATFSTPIALTPGVEYQASMTMPGAGYNSTSAFFASALTPGAPNPLSAPVNAGRFNATPGAMPVNQFGSAFFYIQPVVVV
jgi:hypothetical protein